jgi:hypothetical protein
MINRNLLLFTCLTIAHGSFAAGWTEHESGVADGLRGGAFGNGVYVFSCRGSDGGVVVSGDAANWTHLDLNKDLLDVAFGNGIFIATGTGGSVLTSTDGATWTVLSPFTAQDVQGVCFADGQFVAVSGGGNVYTSPNGSTWTTRITPVTNDLYNVSYGNGKWMAVGSETTIISSPDAITWSDELAHIPTSGFHGIAFGDNTWCAVGNPGSFIQTSVGDGFWNQETSGYLESHDAVTFAFGKFWVTSYDGTILSSNDGKTWSPETSPTTNRLGGIEFLNGRLISVSSFGEIFVYVPDENLNLGTAIEIWIPETVPGKEYQIQLSDDLESWENFMTPIVGDGLEWTALISMRGQNRKFFRIQPDIINGLIAHFPFDGDGADISGKGNHATEIGTPVYGPDRFANSASCLSRPFGDTGANYLEGTGLDIAGVSQTISFWLKTNYSGDGTNGNWLFRIGSGSSAGKSTHVAIDYGQPIRYSFFFDDFDSPTSVSDQGWHHLVFTFDRETMKRRIYIDGELDSENSASFGFSGDSYFNISASSLAYVDMDEFRVYNRALSEEEVNELYEVEH